jgi:DUF4097 and DUF4098 domain-containing protein YvlB
MLKKCSQIAGVLVAVAFLGSIAAAQQVRVFRDGESWVEEVTGSLAAAKTLRVRVDFGAVRVQGGSQSDITYVIRTRSYSSNEKQARREFENFKINASSHADVALIEGDWQGGRHHLCSGEFVINVPRNLDLAKLETSGGDLTVNGITGHVEAQSGGGKVRIDDIGGPVTAETGGDSIEIGTVNGDLRLETGGGRINISNAKGRVTATTGGGNILLVSGAQAATLEAGGGNIEVRKCGGKLTVSTGGGNVELGDISGPVEIQTGGGSIKLGWAKGIVRAETGSGRIELMGVSSARAETGAGGIMAKFISSGGGERIDSVLETSAGDIVVYIAPDVAMTIRASIDLANGHKIMSDFTDIRVTSEGGDWPGPKSFTAEGKLNGGGPILKVRTTTGDIKFLRASR